MALLETIDTDIKKAMLAREADRLQGLRSIKSALIVAKTAEGAGGNIDADTELKILQKLAKQRKESAEIYLQQNREDLAKIEQDELVVIEEYLPKQIGDDELQKVIQKIIADTGASSIKDMGKVMGMANKQLAGQADGKAISAKVKELLGL